MIGEYVFKHILNNYSQKLYKNQLIFVVHYPADFVFEVW